MKATLQKLSANTSDKNNSVQFRVDKDESLKDLLKLRRGQNVTVEAESNQSSISKKGKAEFKSVAFVTDTISVSICILEDGQIATITFSVEDKTLIEKVIDSGLRGQRVELNFS